MAWLPCAFRGHLMLHIPDRFEAWCRSQPCLTLRCVTGSPESNACLFCVTQVAVNLKLSTTSVIRKVRSVRDHIEHPDASRTDAPSRCASTSSITLSEITSPVAVLSRVTSSVSLTGAPAGSPSTAWSLGHDLHSLAPQTSLSSMTSTFASGWSDGHGEGGGADDSRGDAADLGLRPAGSTASMLRVSSVASAVFRTMSEGLALSNDGASAEGSAAKAHSFGVLSTTSSGSLDPMVTVDHSGSGWWCVLTASDTVGRYVCASVGLISHHEGGRVQGEDLSSPLCVTNLW